MWAAIRNRLEIFRDIAERPWFRAFIFVWGAVGAWDLALSQFVPEEYSRNFPKLYQVVGMTAGWLSLWAWLMIGALSLVAGAIEWAFRHKKRYLELLHQPPIKVGDKANQLPLCTANVAPVSVQIEAKVPKPKKVFVNVSPSYLVGLYENRTKVQGDDYVAAYIGKWIPVTGTVDDIRTTVTGTLYVQIFDNDGIFISATLNAESSETISHIARGATITVRGEIYLVDKSGVMLRICELDETSPS